MVQISDCSNSKLRNQGPLRGKDCNNAYQSGSEEEVAGWRGGLEVEECVEGRED